MKITKGKVIGVIILIALCIPFTAWKESKVKCFPVSIFSSYVEDENRKTISTLLLYLTLQFGYMDGKNRDLKVK
ncbi:Uncharacterized protein BC141101_00102 [Bacillus toyonensis]|nr:hypothetical protein IGK_00092 [Bacillus toyonensis]MCS3595382.1 hypothetical protein [Bacillus sp. JUb91]EJR59211.1 hypothetical protein IK3_04646 [Bacillus toyonensis]EJV43758.1 hypothetical protein IEA_04581 [Bacillus toyonensis]EJV46274.1 hypothetical protein IEK_04531 [Bacillus toyonensis]